MRKQFFLFMLALLPVAANADESGTCGDNLTWTYEEATKTLTISGTGEMEYSSVPWSQFRGDIKKLVLEEGMTTIGSNAFSDCDSITAVTIPNSVKSIGFYAFEDCISLVSLVVGTGVTFIGYNAFSGTSLKKTIWLPNTPPSGSYYSGWATVNYVANEQYGGDVVYPFLSSMFEVNGIRYVPVSPSERTCDAIDAVYDSSAANTNISSTVTYRGITMSVQKVQPYLCYNNPYVENLTCDNDGEIAQYAFHGCKNMKSATLGGKITSIGNYAFSSCSSLQSIVIPDAVKTIGDYAFYNCRAMTKLIVGSQVEDIGEYAFQNCSSLIDVSLGASVKRLGRCSFFDCTLLPAIRIPNAVTEIGGSAFNGCKGLKTVIIADRESELKLNNNYIFSDCPLDSVYIGGNITYSTYSNSGYSPFYRNTTLRTVVITDKEAEISENEFYGCTNLQNFTVGDGVTTFGDRALSGCSSLKSLTFGTQLKSIGKEAFSDCVAVTKIVSRAATPPTCGTQALDDISKWTCTLYVPEGSKSAYQGAEQWKEFFFMEEGDGGGNQSTEPDNKKCAKPTIAYNNGKLTFNCETEDAVCQSTITDSDIRSYISSEVQLGVTYTVSVYATKAGYENSDVATATLCWIDVEPKTEGIENGIAQVAAHAVMIQSSNGVVDISGIDDGTHIAVYSVDGRMAGSTRVCGNQASVVTNLRKGEIAIIKIGEKSVKVVMR